MKMTAHINWEADRKTLKTLFSSLIRAAKSIVYINVKGDILDKFKYGTKFSAMINHRSHVHNKSNSNSARRSKFSTS